jgi:hypothetical protein
MNKHQAVYDFVSGAPLASDWYFNFAPMQTGDNMVAALKSEQPDEQFIDGSGYKAYDFTIVLYRTPDKGEGSAIANIADLQVAQSVMDWLRLQDEAGNFPDFGEDCIVERIEILNNMPQAAELKEVQVAQYTFSCRIKYFEL